MVTTSDGRWGPRAGGGRVDAADLYQQAADMHEPKFGKDDEYVVKCRAKARELSATPPHASHG